MQSDSEVVGSHGSLVGLTHSASSDSLRVDATMLSGFCDSTDCSTGVPDGADAGPQLLPTLYQDSVSLSSLSHPCPASVSPLPSAPVEMEAKRQLGIFATPVVSEIQDALSKAIFLEASANSTLDEEAFVLQAPETSTQRVAMHKPAPFTFSRQEPAPFIE